MKSTARLRPSDAVMTVGSVAVLLAAIAMMNETVYRCFVAMVRGDFRMAAVTIPNVGVQQIILSFIHVVGRDHLGLAAFGTAGAILFVVMLRT